MTDSTSRRPPGRVVSPATAEPSRDAPASVCRCATPLTDSDVAARHGRRDDDGDDDFCWRCKKPIVAEVDW